MAELMTKQTDLSYEDFLNNVENDRKREDSWKIAELMEEITGEKPKMWGPTIIGFGSYHYEYKSGREGDWFFTPETEPHIIHNDYLR